MDWNFDAIITPNFNLKHFPPALAAIAFLEFAQLLIARTSFGAKLSRLPTLMRWPAYIIFMFGVILFGVYRSNQFIYFQF